MITVAERRRRLDAMVDELVEAGVPRAEAAQQVQESALDAFDVIVDDTPSSRRVRRTAPRASTAD